MHLAENTHNKSLLKAKDQFKLSNIFDVTITEEDIQENGDVDETFDDLSDDLMNAEMLKESSILSDDSGVNLDAEDSYRSISNNMENKTTQQLIEELSQTITNLRQSLLGNRPKKSTEQVSASDNLVERIKKSSLEHSEIINERYSSKSYDRKISDERDNNDINQNDSAHENHSSRLQRVVRQSSVDAHSINSFEEYSDSLRESQVSLYDDHDIDEFADFTETEETDDNCSVKINQKRSYLELSLPVEMTLSTALDQTAELLQRVELEDHASVPVADFSESDKFLESSLNVSSSSNIKQESSSKDMSLELLPGHQSLQFYLTQKESTSNEAHETFIEESNISHKQSSDVISNSISLQDSASDISIRSYVSKGPLEELSNMPKRARSTLTKESAKLSPMLGSSVSGGGPSRASLLPLNSGDLQQPCDVLSVSDVCEARLTTCNNLIITDTWQGNGGHVTSSWRDNDNVAAWANSISTRRKPAERKRSYMVNHFNSFAKQSLQRKNSLDLGIVEENEAFEETARSFSGKKSAERKFSNLFNIAENVLDKDGICDITDDATASEESATPSPTQEIKPLINNNSLIIHHQDKEEANQWENTKLNATIDNVEDLTVADQVTSESENESFIPVELDSDHSSGTPTDEDLMYKSTRMDEYIETLYYHLPNKDGNTNIKQEKNLITGTDSDADLIDCADADIADADSTDADSTETETDNADLIEYADDLLNYIKKKYDGKKPALDTNIKEELYEGDEDDREITDTDHDNSWGDNTDHDNSWGDNTDHDDSWGDSTEHSTEYSFEGKELDESSTEYTLGYYTSTEQESSLGYCTSTEQGSEYTSTEQGSEYTSTEQGSEYTSTEQGSGYTSVEQGSGYTSEQSTADEFLYINKRYNLLDGLLDTKKGLENFLEDDELGMDWLKYDKSSDEFYLLPNQALSCTLDDVIADLEPRDLEPRKHEPRDHEPPKQKEDCYSRLYRLLRNDSESFTQNSNKKSHLPLTRSSFHPQTTRSFFQPQTTSFSYSKNITKQTASRRHSTAVTPMTTFGQPQHQRRHLSSPSKPPAIRRHSYIHGSSLPPSHEESCLLSKIPVKNDYFCKENVGHRSLDTSWQYKPNNMFKSSAKKPFSRRSAYSCSEQTTNI